MVSRTKEKWGGVIGLIISTGIYLYNWYLILNQNIWYPKAMFFGSATILINIGLILFPSHKLERIERGENIEHLQGIRLITKRWWVILFISIFCALANEIFIRFFLK